jgi:hypothetical protein
VGQWILRAEPGSFSPLLLPQSSSTQGIAVAQRSLQSPGRGDPGCAGWLCLFGSVLFVIAKRSWTTSSLLGRLGNHFQTENNFREEELKLQTTLLPASLGQATVPWGFPEAGGRLGVVLEVSLSMFMFGTCEP